MTMSAPQPSERNRILIIKHGAFGDLIQASGALRNLRVGHPTEELVLLTTPAYRRLMTRCPFIDRVIVDARPSIWAVRHHFHLARTLHNERFSRVYDLQKSTRTRLYRRWLLPDVDWYGDKSDKHGGSLRETFAAQLKLAGLDTAHGMPPSVQWMADDMRTYLKEQGVYAPYVVLNIGSAKRHPHKRWPHYAQLTRLLLAHGLSVVTVPGPDEMELASQLPAKRLSRADGFLDWFELAGILREAAFVIGNDTGPTHLASALDCTGIAIFGPHTHSAQTGIETDHFRAVNVPDLAALSAADVLEHLSRLHMLDQRPRSM
ncbi:MAG: glycosyltransferase family 9 protein [Xanthomonadales bacterium]|nr:glycosyltransferase family 9 protein [Xanthomonadales bacterium]